MTTGKKTIENKTLAPMYKYKLLNDPHCIMELFCNEWNRLKSNSIHLSGYHVTKVKSKCLLSYNSISYGDVVIPIKKRTTSSGKPLWFNEINLKRMKVNYLLIKSNTSEYIIDSNVITINASSRVEENNDVDSKYFSSGVVILCSCLLDNQKNSTRCKWGQKHHDLIR